MKRDFHHSLKERHNSIHLLAHSEELDEIIEIAIKRHRDKEKLTFSYDQNILAMQGGVKGAKGGKTGKI